MARDSEKDEALEAEPPADSNAEPYTVGPGRPPKQHQFRPGQSGNPSGARRKKSPASPVLQDVRALLKAALNTKVELQQGEETLVLTKLEAGIEQLVHQFAAGDRHARRDVFALIKLLGIDFVDGEMRAIKDALQPISQNDDALLKDFLRRHRDDPPDDLPGETIDRKNTDSDPGEIT